MKNTQYDLIVRYCKNSGSITPIGAFSIGITKLATRISEMINKKGYRFKKEPFIYRDVFGNKREYTRYYLLEEPREVKDGRK